MNKSDFNAKCADIMGYEIVDPPRGTMYVRQLWVSNGGSGRLRYNPYDDLNQLAEVVEKLLLDRKNKPRCPTENDIIARGLLGAFRDFVEQS